MDNAVGGCGLANPSFSRIFFYILPARSECGQTVGQGITMLNNLVQTIGSKDFVFI